MPTITEAPVKGYAHCRNPRCQGSQQEQVDAIRSEESYTYIERGGDLPGQENSVVRITFANEEDKSCPHCGIVREVTDSLRPSYEGEWGNQDFLLDIDVNENGTRFDPSKQAALQAEANDALKADNAALREELAEMRGMMQAFMAQQGRPPESGE